MLTHRFDTAADFIHFIELRTDIGAEGTFLVNDEEKNLARMIDFAPDIYKVRMQPISSEVLARTVEAFRQKASGELVRSAEWRYGLAVDDMIARAHNVDPDLPWNKGPVSTAADVARFLGWLSRDRRIKLGKRVLNACIKSEATGEPEYFTHFQRSRGTVAVYLISGEARKERLSRLNFLVTYAHFKYQVKQAFGVATDAGVSGRSYDFIMTRTAPARKHRIFEDTSRPVYRRAQPALVVSIRIEFVPKNGKDLLSQQISNHKRASMDHCCHS